MPEQYVPGWRDPRKMSPAELNEFHGGMLLDDLCDDKPLTAEQRERLMAWFVDDWVNRHPPRPHL